MGRLEKRILDAMVRVGASATATRIRDELVKPPDVAKVWDALERMKEEGLVSSRLSQHKMRYSMTIRGVKALAEQNTKVEP